MKCCHLALGGKRSRGDVGELDVPCVHAGQVGEPDAGAQRQREDHVVARVRRDCPPPAPLLGFGQGLGGKVRHGPIGHLTGPDYQACTRRLP